MINSFKDYWANTIALVNQTAILASQHGYGMTAMDDDTSIAYYDDSLANFGAAFTAMQETIKNQADSLATMQTQLANIQLCMNVGQQPPSSATPLLNNNAHSPTTTSATVAVRATAVVSHNNQP
jgi:hypothetical protein